MKVSTLSGAVLCEKMRAETDFSPIVQTMVREGYVADVQEAAYYLDAFLQWIALIPILERDNTFVMLKTSVDDVFHAMILNTQFYQDFCMKYFDFFIHHHPIGESEVNEEINRGVRYTVSLLEKTYGPDLHPALLEWRNQLNAGVYVVSCPKCVNDLPMHQSIVGELPTGARLMH
jgi:hypothetical protein